MRTHRTSMHDRAPDLTADMEVEGLCEVAIAHDRYTVAFHVTRCQLWVIDSTGQDQPRGPFLASRQAWAEALDLNTHVHPQEDTPRPELAQ